MTFNIIDIDYPEYIRSQNVCVYIHYIHILNVMNCIFSVWFTYSIKGNNLPSAKDLFKFAVLGAVSVGNI